MGEILAAGAVLVAVVALGAWVVMLSMDRAARAIGDATERTVEAVTRSMFGMPPKAEAKAEPLTERAEVNEQNPFAREDVGVTQADVDAMAPWEHDTADPFATQ